MIELNVQCRCVTLFRLRIIRAHDAGEPTAILTGEIGIGVIKNW